MNNNIRKYINIAKGFQYSVNIGFDIGDDNKIKGFIPTIGSLELLEDMLLSTYPSSTDRARILVGAYGKGKSHIIIVLLSLLMRKDKTLFKDLLAKIKSYNIDLYKYITSYIKSKRCLLPVIIQGSNASITQSLLSGIKKALEDNGLEDVMPDTHYKAAINAIKKWENEFPDTYSTFATKINELVPEFVSRLRDYDVEAYDTFVNLYPSLTSGSEFNPFLGFDVVDLYTDLIKKLRERNYDGIFVVYDEFSKFLEAGITKISSVDIKLLQDFAEKCNRSKENQMHLLLVSHKNISNYIDKLPKQKVDGWRGVSERFKHVEIHNNFSQIYEVISNVILYNKNYKSFCNKNKASYDALKEFVVNGRTFSELNENEKDTVVYNCYPLHPVSIFILPRISEKVAQNERTTFTFLSSTQKNTLNSFIENVTESFPILTPDYIYDYFEGLFKKEVYTSETYKIWKLTTNILNKLTNDGVDKKHIKTKIIKTIALIYIVGQFDKLAPLPEVMNEVFKLSVEDSAEITKAIDELQNKQYVIYMKQSNHYLKLKESTGVNIPNLINKTIETNKGNYHVKDILNKANMENYLYPVRHNDEKEITRYFKFEFITSGELLSINNWNKKIGDTNAVGLVLGVILDDTNASKVLEYIQSKKGNNERIVFIISQARIEFDNIIYHYQAVLSLKEKYSKQGDKLLCQELDIYINDLKEVIDEYVFSYIKPEYRKASYYYKSEKKNIFRKAQISQLLSFICDAIYPRTPIINNEVVNKDNITSVVARYRDKVIDGLLANKLEPNLGLSGHAQDVSIMRSTLLNTNILQDANTQPYLLVAGNDDENIQNVLDVIHNFFKETSLDKEKSFRILYDKLTSTDYGIGIKKGIIPIFIAVILHSLKQYIVITHKGLELEITSTTLRNINDNPDDFYVYLEDWNEDKNDYIAKLEKLFSSNIIEREKEYNTFSYIVKAMQRWFISLPKYTKEQKQVYVGNGRCEKLDKKYISFINSLRTPKINAREYLFDKLFNIFKYESLNINMVKDIGTIKHLLDDTITNLIKHLAQDMLLIFAPEANERSTLSSVLRDWYEGLKDTTKNYLFSTGDEQILALIRSASNDEVHLIQRLCKVVTGLRIDDWDNKMINEFIIALRDFKKAVEYQDRLEKEEKTSNKNDLYTITIIDETGKKETKTFNKVEYSVQAKILYNDLIATIEEEYGESISNSEKRQVLMDIIERLFR